MKYNGAQFNLTQLNTIQLRILTITLNICFINTINFILFILDQSIWEKMIQKTFLDTDVCYRTIYQYVRRKKCVRVENVYEQKMCANRKYARTGKVYEH